MVTISNIAERMRNETGFSASQLSSDTNIEYLIDNVIDHINLVAGTSIADLSGTDGSKSLTASESELTAIKAGVNLMMRAYVDKGPTASMSNMTVSEVVSDPHYRIMMKIWTQSLQYLRGRTFVRT